MEVGDGFAGVGTVVDDHSESLVQTQLIGHIAGDQHQVSEHGSLLVGGLGDPVDPLLGYDQEMDRGHRIDVADDDAELILEFDLGRDLTVDDSGEDGRFGHERAGLEILESDEEQTHRPMGQGAGPDQLTHPLHRVGIGLAAGG